MENYQNTIKRRAQLYTGLCSLVPLCLLAVNWLTRHATAPLNEHDMGFVHGFSCGYALVVIFGTVFYWRKVQKALKDEEVLKKLYIAETDERKIFIQNKVGGSGMPLAVFLLSFAAVIACYFNMVVTYTLIAAALGLAMMMLFFKLYYRNKY